MGTIRTEVWEHHLNFHPEEEAILKPFLPGYFVTWASVRRAYNTELSVYFLNPEPFMAETFGFDREIMLVYSKYKRIQSCSIQAAEEFMSDDLVRGRAHYRTHFSRRFHVNRTPAFSTGQAPDSIAH